MITSSGPRPAHIFHFADATQWAEQRLRGEYAPPGWEREGFIHCATADQIPGVTQRHLQGRTNLLRLTLAAADLGDCLRYDWSEASGDWYPHVYSPIPVSAVCAAEIFLPEQGSVA